MRSPSVMAGYLPDEATAEAFADGWYRTGDVGWLEPEGWVHLTDRSKEMIKVNGFQVAPAEIEAVLLGHPAVLDCAVFGVADERAGEVPVAAVHARPRPCRWPTGAAALVADSLATYKHLRHVVVVDDIPRLPSGKVLRRVLRDEWSAALLASRGGRLMDVRLSPEQQALRDSAAQVVDQLGPNASASSTTPSGRPSSTPPSPHRAGATCGRADRRRRTAGLGSGGGHRGRGARPGAGRRVVPRARRWPPSSAGWPARRRADGARPSHSTADSRRWPSADGGTSSDGGHRRAGLVDAACSWSPTPTATAWPGSTWVPARSGRRPDPARRWPSTGCRAVTLVEGPHRLVTADDLSRWTALGLAAGLRRPGRDHARRRPAGLRVRRRAPAVRRAPSARSRPSSTCWRTPSC